MDVDEVVPASKGKRAVGKKRKAASSNKDKKTVAGTSNAKSKRQTVAESESDYAEEEIPNQPAKRTKKTPSSSNATAAAAATKTTNRSTRVKRTLVKQQNESENGDSDKSMTASSQARSLKTSTAASSLADGTVHPLPSDFRKAIASDSTATSLWLDITPLARNEWICWATSAKKEETRKHRIEVGIDKMRKGMRRPCCWPGCPHR